jgi:hypothetical protein
MNPERRLRRLCRRHRVSYEDVAGLLPLLRRAARTPSREVRRSLIAFVEAAVTSKGAEQAEQEDLQERMEQSALAVLAGLLHRWEPGLGPADGPAGS